MRIYKSCKNKEGIGFSSIDKKKREIEELLQKESQGRVTRQV
jgi:hypothetical protein